MEDSGGLIPGGRVPIGWSPVPMEKVRGIWLATVAHQQRDLTARLGPNSATNSASASDLGFRDTADTAPTPLNTPPGSSHFPSRYCYTPPRCPTKRVPERMRTRPGTAVHPASEGVLRA